MRQLRWHEIRRRRKRGRGGDSFRPNPLSFPPRPSVPFWFCRAKRDNHSGFCLKKLGRCSVITTKKLPYWQFFDALCSSRRFVILRIILSGCPSPLPMEEEHIRLPKRTFEQNLTRRHKANCILPLGQIISQVKALKLLPFVLSKKQSPAPLISYKMELFYHLG